MEARDVGGSAPVRECNLHDDCDVADQTAQELGKLRACHCYDECCPDCFGD